MSIYNQAVIESRKAAELVIMYPDLNVIVPSSLTSVHVDKCY